MTLATIIETLKMIALKHPNVNSAYEGNIYEILNANPNNKYASVVITQQSHTTDEVYDHYGFVIFYVDRLVDDMEDNRVQIQSCGKSMLGNIITFFCEEFDAECDNITYQPFTQKFVDMTCGVYCTITIDTVKDVICPEEYWNEDWKTPVIVIHNQDKRVTFTENGTYTIDYDPNTYTGLGTVEVNVNIDVDSYYNNGYNQGKTDGISEQKSKLESINITENGTYTKEDGYSHIEVNVPDLNGSYDEGYAEGERVGYNQGKTDGVNEQKGKLSQIRISENGTYTKEDGYSEVVVDVPDLNGDYNEGYEQGKTDGVNEQKSKLESISITENGVYSKEDGYNHIEVNVPDLNGSYDEGYDQGKADVVANARVLNVTENGVYQSKFSDPIPPELITGVYADGTDFYNYAELNGKVFNTKIAATIDSRLEFWYKGNNTINGDGWNVIIGSGNFDDTRCFQVRYFAFKNDILCIEGSSRVNIDGWDDTVWHHLIVSKTEGIWIDGEKKGDFSLSTYLNGEFFINGIAYDTNGTNTANGTFGMIKIDDVVIIPTADGFLNTNTGELLEVVHNGSYTFTENLPIYPEGELYKTINVNVPDLNGSYDEGYQQGHTEGYAEGERIGYAQGKTDGVNEQKSKLETINITENGRYTKEDGYNEIVVEVPVSSGDYNEGYEQGQADAVANAKALDVTENGQYGDGETLYKTINVNVIPKINPQKYGLRLGRSIFTEVPEWLDFNGITDMSYMFYYCRYLKTIPLLNTSKVTNMSYMFHNCDNLQTIPLLNTSKVTDMSYMFSYCNLKTIPLFDTSNVTTMENMFFNCSNLQTIPQIDTSNVTNMTSMFGNCSSLVSLPALNAQKLSMNKYSGLFGYVGIPKLTDFGGFLNLKSSLESNYNFKQLPNLTYQSCINILNGLYDFTGNGETPNSNQGKLKVHQNFLDKVGDEISIGTAKGWTITA